MSKLLPPQRSSSVYAQESHQNSQDIAVMVKTILLNHHTPVVGSHDTKISGSYDYPFAEISVHTPKSASFAFSSHYSRPLLHDAKAARCLEKGVNETHASRKPCRS